MIPVFGGKVKGGKLKLDMPQGYLVELSRLEGQRIELTIRKERNIRTMNQHRYYFGVVLKVFGDYCGYDPEELHEACKHEFLRAYVTIGEKAYRSARSTTTLTTEEFSEYLDKVIRLAAEQGCYIPQPGEAGW